MKKYKVVDGTRGLKDDDAQVIGGFLEETFPDGKFTPKDVLKSAQPKSSKIHKYFTWDDKEAAGAYRIEEAKYMIRHIAILEDDGIDARAYQSLIIDENITYVDQDTVSEDEDLLTQVLHRAVKEAVSWSLKYRHHKQLKPIFKSINKVEREVSSDSKKGQDKGNNSTKHPQTAIKNGTDNNRRRHTTNRKKVRGKSQARNRAKTTRKSQGKKTS